MTMSKQHRFGLITFFILIILAILVTIEPWKKFTKSAQTSLLAVPPSPIFLKLESLSDGYPGSSTADTIRSYKGFDLAYNEASEQAAWVVYVLTREEVEKGSVARTDNFRSDKSILTGSASLADYRKSGFDRGHLAPAGDMKWDKEAMSQSFLMSNMSPQNPSFNRGIWRELEEQVRRWALERDSLYIVCGPVLSSIEGTIGENQVGVPGYYFKIIVDLSPPGHGMIAFLMPNEGSDLDLDRYAISVDSLESFTGYNFFELTPEQESIEWLEDHPELFSLK